MLTVFFDGVPPLHAEEPESPSDQPSDAAQRRSLSRPKGIEIVSIHDPVADKECEECHASARSNRLVAPKQDLCWSWGLADHRAEKGEDCQSCHDPHAASRKYMLKRDEDQS
jgi:predicted CXXCH cytochrome family protein